VNDPFVQLAEKVLDAVAMTGSGGYLVDSLPFMKHIPAWVPGAKFQRDAAAWRDDVVGMPIKTMEYVYKEMVIHSWHPKPRYIHS
jgi:hypothetical protein